MEKVKLFYVQTGDPSEDWPSKWGIFEGEITKDERNLLDLQALGEPWQCCFDHGPSSEITLLSFFVSKYPPNKWWDGDPTALHEFKEDTEQDLLEMELFVHSATMEHIEREFDYCLPAKFFVDRAIDKDREFAETAFNYIEYAKEIEIKQPGLLPKELKTMIGKMEEIFGLDAESTVERGEKSASSSKNSRDASPERK
jgi:hypothetical protein